MDYNKIEKLVELSKLGDGKAKENLAKEFAPLILNLSKKSFINSYESEDIKNECFKTLFKCVNLYTLDKHRFVAYATNAIKNSVNNLIRISIRRDSSEGSASFVFDDNLENTLYSDVATTEDLFLNTLCKNKLKAAVRNLNYDEQELITYVYFKGYSLKKYATFTGISYYSAISKKNCILNKLKIAMTMTITENKHYLN